jgi:hypothetical protein
MRSRTAMVGQMLHLRAAAIADACGHFLCIGCSFEHRGSIAEKNQADEWQKKRFATVQFEAFSKKNRHLREFPWPARSVTRPGEPLVRGSKITALRSWRCPRFCHGAVDDVALDSLASWARKRSQVLARHARLDRGQPHGRTTSGALRTLVLGIEHGLLLRNQRSPAVPGSPASQPAAVDLKGSDAMTLISTWSHFGHSNNRCSKPIGPAETRSSIILVWQCEQRRRSTAVKDCGDEGTMPPLHGRKSTTGLPVADTCLAGDDGANLAQPTSATLVNIDHS